jgi:hypothetical protein
MRPSFSDNSHLRPKSRPATKQKQNTKNVFCSEPPPADDVLCVCVCVCVSFFFLFFPSLSTHMMMKKKKEEKTVCYLKQLMDPPETISMF